MKKVLHATQTLWAHTGPEPKKSGEKEHKSRTEPNNITTTTTPQLQGNRGSIVLIQVQVQKRRLKKSGSLGSAVSLLCILSVFLCVALMFPYLFLCLLVFFLMLPYVFLPKRNDSRPTATDLPILYHDSKNPKF